jgi:hypothetical protein
LHELLKNLVLPLIEPVVQPRKFALVLFPDEAFVSFLKFAAERSDLSRNPCFHGPREGTLGERTPVVLLEFVESVEATLAVKVIPIARIDFKGEHQDLTDDP